MYVTFRQVVKKKMGVSRMFYLSVMNMLAKGETGELGKSGWKVWGCSLYFSHSCNSSVHLKSFPNKTFLKDLYFLANFQTPILLSIFVLWWVRLFSSFISVSSVPLSVCIACIVFYILVFLCLLKMDIYKSLLIFTCRIN